MKSLFKYLALLLLPGVLFGLWSCHKEEVQVNNGDPVIYYVRSTDPAKADSLLVGTFLGSLVAIVGDNLSDTKELYFNDQKATLNPTYITQQTILVNVPSSVPTVVTNKIRLVTGSGKELLYDFSIDVPAPVIASIKSEYVPDGGVAQLEGDYFFEPKVYFPGDLEAQVVSFTKTHLEVIVPAGATPGQIKVKTSFGAVKSKFLFRDDRNVLLDYDTKVHESWTAPTTLGGTATDPAPISGKYAYFKNAADGAWMWVNELTMQYWAPRGRGNVPVATGSVDDLVLRFEANVPQEWKDVRMEIFFGPFAEDHGRDLPGTVFARWRPWVSGPYKTDGWVTVEIPLTDFKYTKDEADDSAGSTKISNLSSLTNITMMLFGPAAGSNPVYIAVDNVRVVPK